MQHPKDMLKNSTSLKELNSNFIFMKSMKRIRNRNIALVRTATNPTINNETMRNDTVSFCIGAVMAVTLSTSRIRIFCLRKDHFAVLVNSAFDVDL
ncbi:hypothetical protein T4B_12205 [Trichinella pseudospiralis]|uniref:Uncharacterized protein n=1 Tax=Trichinella pseudospiralis TaxID=6337 RepID=A0A0V1JJM5_TRIPS|nr:hypothetical protein T4A_7725 [Trichinella pseudospiralis]KRZ18239.1 hypothetical protein T4B_12205 [Trichinella pseudospiralis]KRZ35156.1 hypothetical protein T4C_692 [Trichinella pseudospiralis]